MNKYKEQLENIIIHTNVKNKGEIIIFEDKIENEETINFLDKYEVKISKHKFLIIYAFEDSIHHFYVKLDVSDNSELLPAEIIDLYLEIQRNIDLIELGAYELRKED